MAKNSTPQVLTRDETEANTEEQRKLQMGKANEERTLQEQIQPNYPSWPTSKPGPRATPSPQGMRSINTMRREQVAEIDYNQELGESHPRRIQTAQELLGKRKERLH